MKERPILFSGPMVRALLAGNKTQTRRIVRGSLGSVHWCPVVVAGYGGWVDDHGRPCPCPYGQPGDRLWVRETWFTEPEWQCVKSTLLPEHADRLGTRIHYAATSEVVPDGFLRPSIFMRRWMSRITLEITDVRVERLNDISEEDAKAEGCVEAFWPSERLQLSKFRNHRAGYSALWESINGAGSWAANPWVWVITFRKLEGRT